jgi:hypothetical protein
MMVISTTNNNFKVVTGVLLFLSMIVLLMALSDPVQMVHKQVISKIYLDELNDTLLTHMDEERIRKILLESLRIHYSLSKDELLALKVSELRSKVKDRVLLDFIMKTKRYTGEDLEDIVVRIQRWSRDVE